jgi:predicted  nucleic acid-binding Zn-ribbon protein
MFDLSDIANIKANAIADEKIEKHRAEMAKTKTAIAEAEQKLEQLEHQYTRVTNSLSARERKARTRRLIERGAIAESFIKNAESLTNDEFKAILTRKFTSDIVALCDEKISQTR